MPDVDIIRELAAVPLASLAIYLMYRLSTNHMNSLSGAITRMAEAIDDLKEWLMTERNRK